MKKSILILLGDCTDRFSWTHVIKFDSGLKRIYVACSTGSFSRTIRINVEKLEGFPVQGG